MQQENNELISGIDEINNFFIEQRSVVIVICRLDEGIDHSSMHSNHIKETGKVFREFLRKIFNTFKRHNYMPKKMLHGEIRSIMKDNKIC